MTRRRVIASNVSSPTNFRAECVMTAATSCPRFCSPRATSTALYAPIPPVTPKAINDTEIPRFKDSMIHRLVDSGLGIADERLGIELLDLPLSNFLLRELRRLLRVPGRARCASGEELPCAGAGKGHELELVPDLI